MGVSPPGRFSADRLALSNLELAASSNLIGSLPKYLIDAFQRNILFLIFCAGAQEEIEITSRPMRTVLRFDMSADERTFFATADQLFALRTCRLPGVAIDRANTVVVWIRGLVRPGYRRVQTERKIGDL